MRISENVFLSKRICLTIWASSIAASAGESHPLLLNTSTQAWTRRMAWEQTLTAIDSMRQECLKRFQTFKQCDCNIVVVFQNKSTIRETQVVCALCPRLCFRSFAHSVGRSLLIPWFSHLLTRSFVQVSFTRFTPVKKTTNLAQDGLCVWLHLGR